MLKPRKDFLFMFKPTVQPSIGFFPGFRGKGMAVFEKVKFDSFLGA